MDSASLFPPKTINAVIYNDGSVLLINPAILKLPCIKLNNFDIRYYKNDTLYFSCGNNEIFI